MRRTEPRPARRAKRWGLSALLLLGAASGCASRAVIPTVEIDVPYAERSGEKLRADLYRPDPALPAPRPAVLLVHGGSWQRGDKEQMASIAERLAGRGYVAVSVNYRLAPEHRFPAQLHDLKEAMRWLRRGAQPLGIDPERIGAFGYSAGGHLVGLLAVTGPEDALEGPSTEDAPPTHVQAAVLGAAPTDLTRFPSSSTFVKLFGAGPEELPEAYRQASPLTHVSADDPPIFLYHGADDWLVDVGHSRDMASALDAAGVPNEYVEAPHGHFWTFLFDDSEFERAAAFLDRWLMSGAPVATLDVPEDEG